MSTPSLKARKDLLKVRATLERVELADRVVQVRESVSPTILVRSLFDSLRGGGSRGGMPSRGGWQGALAGGLGGLRSLGIVLPGGLAASAPALALQAFKLFRRAPVKASLISLASFKLVKTGLKLGAVGFLGYQGWKLWSHVSDGPAARIRRFNRQVPADVGYEAGLPPPRTNTPYR